MNWLYDHLRLVPRYRIVVFSDTLENRDEFPLLEARNFNRWSFHRRLWRGAFGERLPPGDWWRLKWLAPCLLHSHSGYTAVGDLLLQKRLDLPWVVSFYGADVYQLGRRAEWRYRYRRVFDRALHVLALGPVMARHLEQLGCPPEKVVVHPLGVDVETLPSRPRVVRRGDPLRILCAGTFREKKGFEYAIRAVALVRNAGVPLKLYLVGDEAGKAGDRDTKQALLDTIRSLNLAEVTSHLPFLTFRRLMDLALKSDLFLAPSVTAADGDAEGTPFVLQQMMATGMPAIATTHTDIPYLFGELGDSLVPERDVPAIARRLQHYADNPEAFTKDGMALAARIRQRFAARECAWRLADLYDVVSPKR
jgi:colanic acid/amylovoran biosynthesis glycosyltransferase